MQFYDFTFHCIATCNCRVIDCITLRLSHAPVQPRNCSNVGRQTFPRVGIGIWEQDYLNAYLSQSFRSGRGLQDWLRRQLWVLCLDQTKMKLAMYIVGIQKPHFYPRKCTRNALRSRNPKVSWESMPPDPLSSRMLHVRKAIATPTQAMHFYLTTWIFVATALQYNI